MLDRNFCDYLEYKLSPQLEEFNMWCDGIALPYNEYEYSKKTINDKRQIIMSAWIGESGQDKYELQLNFGSKALSRYARDLNILECIPESNDGQWINVDVENRIIRLQLL